MTTLSVARNACAFLGRAKERFFTGYGANVFAFTDYGFLGTPHLLGLHSNGDLEAAAHNELMHDLVVAEIAGVFAGKAADAFAYAAGYESEFLSKLPMRVLGLTHIVGLGPLYALNGEYTKAAFTISVGIGNHALIGDVQKYITPHLMPKGSSLRSYAESADTWFAAGMTAAASLASPEVAVAMTLPLARGAYFAEKNARTGNFANHGRPKIHFATALVAGSLASVIALGGENFAQGLQNVWNNLSDAVAVPEAEKDLTYGAIASATLGCVSLGYYALEREFAKVTLPGLAKEIKSEVVRYAGEAWTITESHAKDFDIYNDLTQKPEAPYGFTDAEMAEIEAMAPEA